MRSYDELAELKTLEDRYDYLRLNGDVGDRTFGGERWLNQKFYTSREWRSTRHRIIVRDNGNDLGVEGFELEGLIFIHHINPITSDDIKNHPEVLVDPNNLISVSFRTHNAIHYGSWDQIAPAVDRRPGDTRLW